MIENKEQIENKSEAEDGHYNGVVIYTDGGCRPLNPGNIGWGAHGYLYTTKPTIKGPGLGSHVLTDQGYLPSKDKDKIKATIVQPINYFDFFGSSGRIASNNAAEVDALYHTVEKLKSFDIKKINAYTDSEYLRRGLTEWAPTWQSRNWVKHDGTPVPNSYSWKRLLNETASLKDKGIDLSIEWVKGHSDNFGNTIADKLATLGVMHSMHDVHQTDFEVSPAQGYWKNEVERHPFINYQRLYFNSVREHNIPGHYYTAEPGKIEDQIGKKTPETSYSVIRLKEVDQVIETIKEKQFDISNEINAVIMMRLDRIFHPEVYPYLESHGKYALLQRSKSNLDLNFIDNTPITVEKSPAGLSLRAIESFGLLEEVLDKYRDYRDNGPNQITTNTSFQVHDISSSFYETLEKTKKKNVTTETTLRPEFVVGFKDLMVDVTIDHSGTPTVIKVPLVLGADLPPRNNLKRIETQNPKVYLLTWKESENSIRYACVIEIDSGIGIWSNFFADRIFLH